MKLLKHSLYNLMGLGLPLLAAVFTIPMLIAALGEARFGLLTLIWAVVSYFGLFDLGLGRALTQHLASVFAKNELSKIGPLVGTATFIMTALGVVAGLIMAACAAWGVSLINAVPDKQEAINAVYAMALAMPFIVLTSGFRGILEAQHAFGVINVIRVPMGLFTFIGPLGVVFFGEPRLDMITVVLSFGRLIACAVHAYFAWQLLPAQYDKLQWDSHLLKPLCISGGWLTVSNIVSPLMTYIDRFIIGAIVSASAVTYYVTPNEIITKLWIIPGALTAVLFPTFAAQMVINGNKASILYSRAIYWLYLVMLPITLAIALFSELLLELWINKEFAQQSYQLLQIFSLGMFVTCLANIPFTLLQSADKARTTAIIHLIELPFFLTLLWLLAFTNGIIGAATAWLVRILFDALFLFVSASRLITINRSKTIFRLKIFCACVLVLIAYVGIVIEDIQSRVFWFLIVLVVLFANALRDRERIL